MPKQVKVKPGLAYTKSGVKKISGTATTTSVAKTKKPTLNDFIAKNKKVPSKNKRYPGDSDVKIGPSKGKPIIKLKTKKK